MRLGPHTITVLRAGAGIENAYGNNTPGADAETDVPGCSVQAEPSTEVTKDRDTVVIRKHLFAPVDTALTAVDRVRFKGEVFQVDGDPQREEHGLPADHVFALLRRST